MKPSKKVLFLIEQAGTLLQMPRSHVRTLGNAFDTIASHCYHVSIMAYCIARMEGLSHEDGMKALAIGSFHDLAEGRMADLDFISKNYMRDNEEKAIKDQFRNVDFGKDLEELLEEYNERKSPIAKCVKDADQLAQMYMEWTLMWRGNKLAQRWFEGDFAARIPYFHTESGKQLAFELRESNPNEWWWDELVTKDGRAKIKEHLVGKNHGRRENANPPRIRTKIKNKKLR